MTVVFGESFDSLWWAEQAVIWLIFSVLVSALVTGMRRWLDQRDRAPYTGWMLEVVGFGDKPQALYWEDVRRWLLSPRELWLIVKGTVSGVCQVTPRTVDAALVAGWVRVEAERRRIVVDFNRMPQEHRSGKWFVEPGAGVVAVTPAANSPAQPPRSAT